MWDPPGPGLKPMSPALAGGLLTTAPSEKCKVCQVFVCLFVFKDTSVFFFNLFLAALGLHCCTRAFSSCGKQGLLFIAVHGFLIAVASLVAEHGLYARGLQ